MYEGFQIGFQKSSSTKSREVKDSCCKTEDHPPHTFSPQFPLTSQFSPSYNSYKLESKHGQACTSSETCKASQMHIFKLLLMPHNTFWGKRYLPSSVYMSSQTSRLHSQLCSQCGSIRIQNLLMIVRMLFCYVLRKPHPQIWRTNKLVSYHILCSYIHISLWSLFAFTFQHLDCYGNSFFRFVLIDAQRFCHHHLTETAFTKRLAQRQPARKSRKKGYIWFGWSISSCKILAGSFS